MISIVFYLLTNCNTMVASISFNPFDSRFCSWSCQHFWFNCGVGKGVRCSFPKCASRFVSLGSVERFAWSTKGLSSNSSNQLPWLLEETSQTKCKVQHRYVKRNITTRAQTCNSFQGVLRSKIYLQVWERWRKKQPILSHMYKSSCHSPTGQSPLKIIWTRCIRTMFNC